MSAAERMSWWRAHHGLPSHPRWLQAARKSGQSVPVAFAVATWLLDHASRSEKRGSVADFDAGPCAAYLWIEEEAVCAVVAALTEIGWIVDGHLSSWSERQPLREDPNATERKRNQRERQRHTDGEKGTHSKDASRDVTLCHAPEKIREDTEDLSDLTTFDHLSTDAVDEPVSIEVERAKRKKPGDEAVLLEIADLWNDLARSTGLPQIEAISPRRQAALRARFRELPDHGFAGDPVGAFRKLATNIRGSPLLLGDPGPWRADFDFVVSPKGFTKIMENTYARQQKNGLFR